MAATTEPTITRGDATAGAAPELLGLDACAGAVALELYAKRLERERHRLRAELREAQLRIAWRRHERAARGELDAELVRLLEAAGILAPARADLDDRRTAHRRRCQLAA